MTWQRFYQKVLAKYHAVHDNTTILVLDDQYKILYCSNSFQDITSLEQVQPGANLADFLAAESLVSLAIGGAESRAILHFGHQPPFQERDCIIFRQKPWTVIFAAPWAAQQNKILEVMGSLHTELANTTRELNKKKNRLQTANRQLAAEIAERNRLEATLRASEERYRSMVQHSYDCLLLVDPETGKIVDANQRFLAMTGYSFEELIDLTLSDILCEDWETLEDSLRITLEQGHCPVEMRQFRRRDGSEFRVERTGSMIDYSGRPVMMMSLREVTEQRRLEEVTHAQVVLAGKVQASMLPQPASHPLVTIATIYQPHNIVSGDFYNYIWQQNDTVLNGYIIDVLGHDISVALQTSALNVLFYEAFHKNQSLQKSLEWVNQQAFEHFLHDSFAAALCFSIDFAAQTLTYVSGGINWFLASADRLSGRIAAPGMLIGVHPAPKFDLHIIPLREGDAFYFVTDGLSDQFEPTPDLKPADFPGTVRYLRSLTNHRQDDCAAVCLRIESFL